MELMPLIEPLKLSTLANNLPLSAENPLNVQRWLKEIYDATMRLSSSCSSNGDNAA